MRAVRPRRAVWSIRWIVAGAAVVLTTLVVFVVTSVMEKRTRDVLAREIESRLVLQARNLALTSAGAIVTDYPELTLAPLVRVMQASQPELVLVAVLDRHGVIQGHADVRLLGSRFAPPPGLVPIPTTTPQGRDEAMTGNAKLLLVSAPILNAKGEILGTALVGLSRAYVGQAMSEIRRQQYLILGGFLLVGVAVSFALMSLLLRPLVPLRAGIERIGRGDLSTPIQLADRTEFGLLAEEVNGMASALSQAQKRLLDRNRELHLANERLKELDRLKNEFISNVNHELRTPLAAIIASLECLTRSENGDEEERELLGYASNQSLKLQGLIETLLTFSEAEQHLLRANLVTGDVVAAVSDYYRERLPDVTSRGRELAWVRDETALTGKFDEQLLRQILDVLIDNAVKFTSPAARIQLRVRRAVQDGVDWIAVDVIDDGPGIPPEQLAALFESFRQLDGSMTRTVGGMGIGLSLAQRLAEGLGGRLVATSDLGKGSTFTLLLPGCAEADSALIGIAPRDGGEDPQAGSPSPRP